MKVSELLEDRKKELDYKEEKKKVGKGADAVEVIDRVIVEIKGNESAKFTKLAQRYKSIKAETEACLAKQIALNHELTANIPEYFDAADEVYTRVIETVSMTLTLAKQGKDEQVDETDYEGIFNRLIELLPDLNEKLVEVKKEFTKAVTKKAKKPALGVKVSEGAIGDAFAALKKMAAGFLKSIRDWGRNYDRELKAIGKMIAAL